MPSMKREPIWTPLTETDRLLVSRLRVCTFLPASFEKRFARDMGDISDNAGKLTEKQRTMLCALVWRFRRQIPAAIVAKAGIYLAERQTTHELDRLATVGVVVQFRNPLDSVFVR